MRLVWAQAKASTIELARYPSFSVPTLAFPAALFFLFGARWSDAAPEVALASYAALAVLGVAFFQFGVGIAGERVSPWHSFLRILPASAAIRFAARVSSAAVFGLAATLPVVVLALTTTSASLDGPAWALLAVALAAGAVPLSLLGIALGYWTTPRGALPLANLLFLGLSYAGGLWQAGPALPGSLATVSAYLPTRCWGEMLAAAVGYGAWRPASVVVLSAWGAAFGLIAVWGYRRDEGERFR